MCSYQVGLQSEPSSTSMCTQLSMDFILLINIKMPTIVGILTFISMKNTTSESLYARNVDFLVYAGGEGSNEIARKRRLV